MAAAECPSFPDCGLGILTWNSKLWFRRARFVLAGTSLSGLFLVLPATSYDRIYPE